MKWFYPLWYPRNFFAKSCIRIRYCPQPTRSFIRMGEERMKQHRSAIETVVILFYFILFYFASPLPPAPKYRASCRYANHLQNSSISLPRFDARNVPQCLRSYFCQIPRIVSIPICVPPSMYDLAQDSWSFVGVSPRGGRVI